MAIKRGYTKVRLLDRTQKRLFKNFLDRLNKEEYRPYRPGFGVVTPEHEVFVLKECEDADLVFEIPTKFLRECHGDRIFEYGKKPRRVSCRLQKK